ncbi:unnamed protein product [Ectocarpus sp. CCAP 1310/34]|nr:unnamed protein product [Ectocarpus sp. CCAP 1310/34]
MQVKVVLLLGMGSPRPRLLAPHRGHRAAWPARPFTAGLHPIHGAGMMPGFSDDAARQARQAAVAKVLNDKRFCDAPQRNWSESESGDDNDGEGSPTSSGSSNVSIEDSSAPSDICSQSGDVVFEKEIREAMTGGGGAGARTKNHGKRKASAGGSVVGKYKAAASHHASSKKARGKDYPHLATHFLKRTCAHRKIPRMWQSSKDLLVAALRSLDANMKRSSPYFDDLDAIAAGKSGCGRGSEQEEGEEEAAIPAKAMPTFRGVVNMVAQARDSTEPFIFEDVDYSVANLFDAMEEDKPELGDSAGGSAPNGGSSTGGAAGPHGGGSHGGSGSITERKGPHWMMRLVGIPCEDSIHPLAINSRMQATRQELDTSAVWPRNNLWTEVTDRFRDRGHNVRKIVDDGQVSHVNPNIIQQPNRSAEKITNTWSAARANWNTPYANWTSESGNNQPWVSFSQGDTDTYILGCAFEKYPELDQVCNNLLPEDAQREDDGTGEGDACTGGAERRTAAKREGARLDEQNRRRTKQKKKGGGKSVAEAMSVAMKTALLDIEPLLPRGGSEKSERQLKQQEEQSKSAALDTKAAAYALQKAMCADHQKYSEQVVEEEEKKRPGYQARINVVEQMVAKLEKEMFFIALSTEDTCASAKTCGRGS